jgi:hypothetical protein
LSDAREKVEAYKTMLREQDKDKKNTENEKIEKKDIKMRKGRELNLSKDVKDKVLSHLEDLRKRIKATEKYK